MDFEISEELRIFQDTVRRFVRAELMPLEPLVLQRESQGMAGEDLIPPEEEITFGTQKLRVNNAWIHEAAGAFVQESDPMRRQAIYLEMQNRLAALLEQVQHVRQQPGREYLRERQELAAILSQREFQRHQTDSWMGRLRRWLADTLARVVRLFPGWQRGGSSFTRFLVILVWLLAGAVLYFLIRSIFSGFRREKQPRVSSHQAILGTVIEPHATPAELRTEAFKLAGQRDYRGAIRLLYISLLYELQERGLLQLGSGSTNGEYLRRLRSAVALYPLMLYLTRRFDQFWYGKGSPSEPEYQEFLDHYQTALGALTSQ